MMNDVLKIAIPAIIALGGTSLTLFIGYRQWRKQQEISRYGSFLADKQNAYKGLWERLEEVHIILRLEDVTQTKFDKLIHNVNAFILKQNIYLDDDLQRLSNQYLEKLRHLQKLLTVTNNREMNRDWAVSLRVMIKSDEIDESIVGQARKIRLVQDEVQLLRNQIIEHCKKILGGNLY